MAAEWTPKKIRALRDALGETQEKFATRFRLHPEAVRTWEQSRGNPSGPATVILDMIAAEAAELAAAQLVAAS